jgi:hypothetical protein
MLRLFAGALPDNRIRRSQIGSGWKAQFVGRPTQSNILKGSSCRRTGSSIPASLFVVHVDCGRQLCFVDDDSVCTTARKWLVEQLLGQCVLVP